MVTRLTVGGLDTNCYVLRDTGCRASPLALIDPGGDAPDILRLIDRAGLPLGLILLTHAHSDHIRALPEILDQWPDAPVAVSREDQAMLADSTLNLSVFVGAAVAPRPRQLRQLQGGDRVEVGGLEIKVVATPGHTPGGLCFHLEHAGRHLLFSGDTLFAGSVGRTDLPGGSWRELAGSLRRLFLLPPEAIVYPGHGPASTLAAESAANPYVLDALRP
jgi:glyoxylase-like metal-dependent hydrolase (beta-lactamase superfamily II)